MTADDLDRLDGLFHAALEVPAPDRPAFLRSRCPDETLRARVESLLQAHGRAGEYFDGLSAAVGHMANWAERPQRVGPYEVLRLIGHGGMGSVYLARRSDGRFDQQVALKLIRFGHDTAAGIRRFVTEQRIVARLDHPNIARLFDAGVTDDGRPYFVMELVEGRPITEYAVAARLPVAGRVRLIETVAAAVQHAHQQLVVHRDLKPSNVLVTPDGTVKLVDFGIAKLLEAADTGDATRTTDRALSLPYAAPEQIDGRPVATTTDVYGLGALLYELLAGRRPFESAQGDRQALERTILEREPDRPSVSIADRGERRKVAGDLDVICLTALRRDPARRYASAAALADDLRRHRRGLTVAARPDTVWYRTSRFARRHTAAVATATVTAFAIVLMVVVASREAALAARERDKARAVADLLVRIFEVADPSEARGRDVSARDLLSQGVARIERELASQPDVKASLLSVLGRVHQNLGLYDDASGLFEQARELSADLRGAGDPVTIEATAALAEVLRLRGRYEDAGRLFDEARRLASSTFGPDAPETARALNGLGRVRIATGRPSEAEAFARDALTALRTHGRPAGLEAAESLMTLGAAAFLRGDLDAAEPLFREALDVRRRLLGADHPAVVAALNNLAALFGRRGDFGAAVEAYDDVVALSRQIYGPDHPRVATALNNLALVHHGRGDSAAAEPLLRESLSIRRARLDPVHVETAQSLDNLGLVLQALGRLDESELLLTEARDIRERSLGPSHPLVAQSMNNLGLLARARHRPAVAMSLFQQSITALEASLGPQHPLVATGLHNLGETLVVLDRVREAEAAFRRALDIRRSQLPAGHPETALTLDRLQRLASK